LNRWRTSCPSQLPLNFSASQPFSPTSSFKMTLPCLSPKVQFNSFL
jgi:hypothetical protein